MAIESLDKEPSAVLVPQRIYISSEALNTINNEAKRSSQGGHRYETGGIIIGRRLTQDSEANSILIVGATGPGPKAVCTPAIFEPDVQELNRQLERWRESFPMTDYLGTWHSHPPSYESVSPGDVETAYSLFEEQSYKIDEILIPIAWVESSEVCIRYYWMSRIMASLRQSFIEIDSTSVVAIESNHPLVVREYNPV